MKKLSLHDQINDIEDVVRGFMRRPFAFDSATPEMRLDVLEDDDKYSIQAEIPGADIGPEAEPSGSKKWWPLDFFRTQFRLDFTEYVARARYRPEKGASVL
jgi:hypothetical protein